MNDGIRGIARGHQLVELAVVLGVYFRVLDHALDFSLGQTGTRLDLDLLFLAGSLVLGADVHDAVGIDVKRYLDLRHAAPRRADAGQVEARQRFVGGGDFTFTLQHMYRHRRLVVFGSRKHLCRLGRNGGVLLDQLGHHATQGLDTQRQRGHVQQQYILDFTRQHAGLDCRSNRNGLVRVYIPARLTAKEFGHGFLHLGHARLAAHQDHVIDVADLEARIVQRGAARRHGAGDQVLHQRFKLGAGQFDVQVLGPARIGRDVRQIDLGMLAGRQFDLGALGPFTQPLQGQRIVLQVKTLVFLEFRDQVVNHPLVEILAAQEGIAIGREHFELVFAIHIGDFDDGNVKRTTAKVINGDFLLTAFLVQTIGQGGGGGFVDDALDGQAGDFARILGGLAL